MKLRLSPQSGSLNKEVGRAKLNENEESERLLGTLCVVSAYGAIKRPMNVWSGKGLWQTACQSHKAELTAGFQRACLWSF